MTDIHSNKKYSIQGLIKTIGPGILYAGAAIGASHLVQSTRAGASYGFELVWAVILVNIFKYPFFEYGHRFTAATGKTLIEGYRMLGRWAVTVFFVLNLSTGVINFAAIALVTTHLGSHIFGIDINSTILSISLLVAILLMLFVGRYALLDKLMKILIIVLSIATVTAFIIALTGESGVPAGFIPPDIWDTAGISFLIALMGWMPTPIEASAWPSLWAKEREKQTGYKPKFKEYLADFHIGYIGSGILALFFLGLGALVMYGSTSAIESSGVKFSEQFVAMYTKSLGSWSESIIAGIAFITIFTTALTVIDGYPRSLDASFAQAFNSKRKTYWLWAIALSVLGAVIIIQFAGRMKAFLDFATIISFLAAPLFAYINYRVVTSKFTPKEHHPSLWLKILSWAGIAFLVGFGLLFIVSRFVW